MRVLIIHSRFDVMGGAELIVTKLANYLDNNGHSVFVSAESMGSVREHLNRDIIIVPSNFQGYAMESFDIINPHNHPAELKAYLWKDIAPIVWQFNEPSEHILRGFPPTDKEAEISKHMRIAAADEFNKNRVKNLYGANSTVVNYGIDYDYWSKKVKPYKKYKDNFVVISCGWFNPYKNQLKSAEIAVKLHKDIPNLKWIFTGYHKSPYADIVNKYLRDNDAFDYVEIAGFGFDNDKLRKYYASADVIASSFGKQGGWLSVFESICTDKPVIVSNEVTAASMVREHELAMVSDDFYTDILNIYKSDHPYPIDANALKWIKDNLSWDKYCSKMESIFKEELSK